MESCRNESCQQVSAEFDQGSEIFAVQLGAETNPRPADLPTQYRERGKGEYLTCAPPPAAAAVRSRTPKGKKGEGEREREREQ